ncbi:MAG: restriction endonuclease subunit S [Pseudomonas sp.]|nr:restriction endonuclease subunit S [Pseudomonas sp.]
MAGKYQAYPEYKESGNGWLEKVPATWLNARMDDVALTIKEQVSPRDIESIQVMHYSIPTIQEIGTGREEDGATVDSNKFRVQEGDVLFSKLNPRKQTITTVRSHDQVVVASTEFIVLRSHSDNQRFLQYLLYSQELKSFVCSQVESATKSHQRINPSVVSKLKFALPSKEELLVIVNFLDHETAKIDTLIDKQQQLIQLLKEKRQAVISHAVTKGLNPNAPMRDSGVEWLGEVPEHWILARLKNVLRIRNGRDYKDVEVEEGGYPVYGSGGIFKRSSNYLYDGKSVLFGRKGTIDKPLVVSGKFWTVDTMFYSEVFDNALPEYIYYQATFFPFNLLSTNTALPSMTQEDLLMLPFVVPPFTEQEETVRYVQDKSASFDNLIYKAQSAIGLMQERRIALISAAVTGKVDVRDWVASSALRDNISGNK